MSGTLQFDNVEVFTNPGVGTPFIELTSAPGVTGFRLYTEGSNLIVRDTMNQSTIFGTAGPTGATGPRGLQGNPGIGIQGIKGDTGATGPAGSFTLAASEYGDYIFYNGSAFITGSTNVALGSFAGEIDQGYRGVAMGYMAGNAKQSTCSVAIGVAAGAGAQSEYAIAIGNEAASLTQGKNAVAIGHMAGNDTQGAYGIAIGNMAGTTDQWPSSIIFNASQNALESYSSGLYISPIRLDTNIDQYILAYDPISKEVVYKNSIGIISSFSTMIISSLTTNNMSSLSGQIGGFIASSIVAKNISSISGQVGSLAVSTIRVGTLANNNFVFFSKNKTPYYSNSISSFSLVGENLSNVFYVAKNGDDTLGDGSQMRPFLTISTAVGKAPINQYCAVYVSPGIYEEYVVVTKPTLSMYGTTRGSKFNQGVIIDGSLTIMNNNSTTPNAIGNIVGEYAGLHINQRANNTSTSLITIRDYAVSTQVFQVNFASMLVTAENINAHGLLISSFSRATNGNLTRVNIQNSRFSIPSVSSLIGLKGGMLWEMNDNYVQNTGSGSALEIVGGTGQILDIRNNTLSADTGSALTIDKLFSSFNYGFRRNIITANTNGATVSMTSNNGYIFGVKFPVPFTDNYITNTQVLTGGNSLFEMTGSDNFINLTQNELLLAMPKALFPFNPAYIVRGNTSNTIFHRNNTLAAPNPDTLLSTVGTYSPGMSTVMNPVFLDYIDPQLFISSLTTNNISTLREQVGVLTATQNTMSSIVANNISTLFEQVGVFIGTRNTMSSIVANNISTLFEQVGVFVGTQNTMSSIVANNISTLTEQVGSLIATTINVSSINISSLSQTAPIGNTLTVDAIYGNDTTAALDRYAKPFSTITAALALATSGQNVIVRPGTYNESLIMPDGVSVTGAGTQCVIIQKLNVTSNTTLITMSTNNRFENFTANLTTATNGVDLIGCYLPSRATTTSKIRQSVWNISTATTTPCSTIAMYSPGTTANPSTFSSPNIIQRTTLNVASGNSGLTRGIYVNGPNRFAVRDMVVNARGISSIGIETANPNAFADVKTTSVYGEALDIFRGQGNLELGFTNLQNGTCGSSSFSVVLEPSFTTFGVVGDLKTNHLYYIVPGVVSEATADVLDAANLAEIPVTQNLILIAGTMIFSGTLNSGVSLTFNLYKRIGGVAPDILVYTLQLTTSQKKVVNQRLSVEFDNGDTYYATLTTVGNPEVGTFTTTLSFY